MQPAGPDTFQITERDSPLNGGAATARRDAVNAAEAFCASHNAAFMPGQAEALGRPVQEQLMGPTGFTLTFRCRDADAPPGPGFDDPPQD